MINDKIITYISFAKKSGSLDIGFDAVKSSILSKKAKLILLFDDASDKTKKEIKRISELNNIRCLTLNLKSQDLDCVFYKKVVTVAIKDFNLASAILKLC